MAGGDLDGDFMPEIATLRGTDLHLVMGSQYIGDNTASYLITGEMVFDVCFAKAAVEGEPAFLFTTPQGLKSLTLDSNGVPVVLLLNTSTEWLNAQEVRVGMANGGVEGVFGVSSSRNSVFVSPAFSSGPPTPICTLGPTVTDLVLFDWDSNPNNGEELGLLTSNGLQIRNQTLTVPLIARGAVVPGDAIAAVSSHNKSDALVWLTRDSSGLQSLLLFHPGFTPVYQVQMQHTGLPFSSITAADLDGDGNEDLLLSSTVNYVLSTVLNMAKGPTWSEAFKQLWLKQVDMTVGDPAGAPNTGQVLAIPLWNFTSPDGGVGPDIALCLPHRHQIRRYPWTYLHPGGYEDKIEYMMATTSSDFEGAYYNGCNPEQVYWSYTLGTGWGSNISANAIQVQFFPYDGFTPPQCSALSVNSGRYNIVYEFLGGVAGSVEGRSVTLLPLNSLYPQNNPPANRANYVRFRPVFLDNGTITAAWRWSIASMTKSADRKDCLESRPGSGPELSILQECGPSSMGPSAGSGARIIVAPVLQGEFPLPGLGVPAFQLSETDN